MRRYVVGGLILGAILFFVFGQMLVVPPFIDWGTRQELARFLQDCPQNELRLKCYTYGPAYGAVYLDSEGLTLNFDTGSIVYDEKSPTNAGEELFWMQTSYPVGKMSGYLWTAESPRPSSYTPDQLVKVRAVLDSFPPMQDGNTPYLNEVHIAFWRQHQLIVDHLSTQNKAQLDALTDALLMPRNFLHF